ncbi:phage holin family protein [Ilyomonas limi]|uniref:Phage holin family protein n=1 Tax=Ilyomonas limi TaxID=2575867 RepID=A0A4V5UUG0_9BACT|nr:phage holin family protein [Ilyomonas limi]TKK68593.1 phage holin family protein [Ilyomonas limi]
MSWILQLIINAGVLLLLAYIHPGVKVRSFGTAVGVALVIGILNATIGFLLRFTLNLMTLWLLSFLVRLFVTAIVIWLTDKLFSGFQLRSFGTAVLVACVLAIVGTLLAY